ncbi:MAG TPA: glycosyltransferase family 2 protein [Bryobacteraceae bacterium]
MLSLVIPVYKNQENLDRLLGELVKLAGGFPGELEVVFVIDGSPDACYEILRQRLPRLPLRAQLISLTRNFGSFSAIAAGLAHGGGDYFAALAADLQEPPELVLEFYRQMHSGAADIVFGCRAGRGDPWSSRLSAGVFWFLYRSFVIHDMPAGGVDVFGCTRRVRDELLRLHEANTNLIALLLWLGFRRSFVPYRRSKRAEGRSAWTLRKKLRYALDSIFTFTDLPLRLLLITGLTGTLLSALVSCIVVTARALGGVSVPDYAPIVLAICFFGGLTTFALGVLGQYLWLTLQNARGRPNFLVASRESFHSCEREVRGDLRLIGG